MPNGDDFDDPFDFRFPRPQPRRPGLDFDDEIDPGDTDTDAGLPVPVIPIPTQPTAPTRPPVSFPRGVAANDPVFSRAIPFLRIGSVVVGVASFFDFVIREAQEEAINRRQRERDEEDALLARRSGADNPLGVVVISAPIDRPLPQPTGDVVRPRFETSPSLPRAPSTPIELPDVDVPAEVTQPATQPVEIPAPGVDAPPGAAPSAEPLPVGVPGIGSPTPVFVPPPRAPGSFPFPPPSAFPIFSPVSFPTFTPIGDPLTPFVPGGVPSPTPPQIGDIDLPQPQPQPQPRQKRCRPCPKKKKPRLRDKCFKGLYREGPFDDDVDFEQWAQIDCASGRELGRRRRPTGRPNLRRVK